ncbi:aKG-HExxH-type peptide beta-hydroxylase [Actinophytocola sp.]|uniref:aKG-HExxH-type peptide beta-hydroxylase n=1 Tax=Actinophytocola sp. TaxID=1872138 RepID=UPI002ECFEA40
MTDVSRLRLSAQEFAELASGGGDAAVVERLRVANRSRTLLAIAFLATETAHASHPDTDVVERAYRVLTEAREHDQDAVWHVVDEPEVTLWAVGAARELVHGGTRFPPALLANVAAAAAVRAGVDADLPAPDSSRLPLPSLGTVTTGGLQIRVRPDGVHVGAVRLPADFRTPAPGWAPLATARLGTRTVTFDRWLLTAPPAPFDTDVLTSTDADAWSRVLSGAVDLLGKHGVADSIVAAVRTITPLRQSGTVPASATLSDAFGSVLMSLPPDARSAALALVHEVQHAKLTVVLDLFPLLETSSAQRFYAPWRTDPRPLLGLLHGAYAYVGVVGFWRRQRMLDTEAADVHEAEVEFARWLTATEETVAMLVERPELTDQGRALVAGMAATLTGWADEPVSPTARAEAERLRLAHRTRWQRA